MIAFILYILGIFMTYEGVSEDGPNEFGEAFDYEGAAMAIFWPFIAGLVALTVLYETVMKVINK